MTNNNTKKETKIKTKMNKTLKRSIITLAALGVLGGTFTTGVYASSLITDWAGRSDYESLVLTLDGIGIKGKSLKADLALAKLDNGVLTATEIEMKVALIQAGIDKDAALVASNIAKDEALALSKSEKAAALAALEIAKAEALAALEISKAEALAILEIDKANLTRDNAALTVELAAASKQSSDNKDQLTQATSDMKDARTDADNILIELNK